MGTMFDSVSPGDIPADAVIVAGYIDGAYRWEPGDWARFPHAAKVRIAVFASTDDGRVLDVEKGDATAQEAPGWVTRRRQSTEHPLSGPAVIYTSLSNWQAVKDEFAKQGVAPPEYWIAHYDGIAEVPAGAVAKQYQSTSSPNIDTSVTLGTWPNEVAPTPAPTPAPLPVDLPEVPDMAVITTDPNNNGKVILDPASGEFYGISEPAVFDYYVNEIKVPVVPGPSVEVFSHFKQVGTI